MQECYRRIVVCSKISKVPTICYIAALTVPVISPQNGLKSKESLIPSGLGSLYRRNSCRSHDLQKAKLLTLKKETST